MDLIEKKYIYQSMEEKNIISPCISVCKTDPVSGYCYGCGRTNEDKVVWKNENTTNEWKVNNLKELKTRLSNWQLDAFEKSYQSKIETGLSLIKKKILDSQNRKN
ncbi:uncharacterized protein METZ01_LOCUS371254 [marine metagenome]|uniref:DUF1289 domain-containing protein n=1 Tax=marine metagenome TaxID=408172 RepID=A0A382T8E0_9ZZZZ